MKGQISVEYLMIFGSFLVVFGSLWVTVISPSEQDLIDISALSEARELSDRIAEAVNSVYSSSRGATRIFLLKLSMSCLVVLENETVRVSTGGEIFETRIRKPLQGMETLGPGSYKVTVRWANKNETTGIFKIGENVEIRI